MNLHVKFLNKLSDRGVSPFIIAIDSRPIGYIQYYGACKVGGGWWPETKEGTFGIDQFIGDPLLVGKGLGTRIITQFVGDLFLNPSVVDIISDPDPQNKRPIRAYEKVGFKSLGEIETPGGNALLMKLERTLGKTAVLIREMRKDDLPEVRRLAEQLGYPVDLHSLSRRYHAIENTQIHKLFVASSNGKVFGWIHVGKEMSSLLAEERADIGALVVDSHCRSQGIGALLMAAAEKWAKSQKLDLVRVRSNVKRTDAHRFYQRQGYALTKSWNLFTKKVKEAENAD